MRVPTRKPGKFTGVKPDPFLSREKFAELKNRLERMKRGVPRAIAEVKRLASDGDFSENAAYQIAKGKLRGLNRRIDELEDHLKRAVIIEKNKNDESVALGDKVTVETSTGRTTFRILGSSETDPEKGIISRNSPLGSALLGRRVGESVTVRLANKEKRYKIIKIE